MGHKLWAISYGLWIKTYVSNVSESGDQTLFAQIVTTGIMEFMITQAPGP